ncbi:DUF397 domain-containing protein [Actinomadura fulvescens]|uniref:DUF397 domain-containing protein n=1 Tax=Actinomadura fulvescens TaxID=46160 RepID=A0ABN3QZG7_9ACTN
MDLTWRKASRSSAEGDNCVELANRADAVAVRDSKDPHGPVLVVTRAALRKAIEAAGR